MKSDYCVEYNFYYLIDTTNSENFSKKERVILYGNKDLTLFIPKNVYLRDSIQYTIIGNEGWEQFKSNESISSAIQQTRDKTKDIPRSWYPLRVRRDLKENKSYLTYASSQYIHTSSELYSPNWKIHEEKDTIADFNVIKATTRYGGRNYVAWFCPEIPISQGPYKFYGLPGLILKLHDEDGYFHFNFVSIQGSYPKYFSSEYNKPTMSRSQMVEKLKSELVSSTPETLQILGMSASARAEQQLKQNKKNSKLTFLVMELE